MRALAGNKHNEFQAEKGRRGSKKRGRTGISFSRDFLASWICQSSCLPTGEVPCSLLLYAHSQPGFVWRGSDIVH